MPTRIEIRHAIVNALQLIPGLTVKYEQHISNLSEVMPAAVVYFEQVEITEDLKGNRNCAGTLGISAFMPGTDDDIDPLVDDIIAYTDLAIQSPNPLGTAWTLNSISYDHETQPGTVGATVTFTIWFNYDDGS